MSVRARQMRTPVIVMSDSVRRAAAPAVVSIACAAFAGGECVPSWDAAIGAPGLDGAVFSVAALESEPQGAVYVGGLFLHAGGVSASRIARWNGAAWEAVGGGMNNQVRALLVYDFGAGERLVAAGTFTSAGLNTANRLATLENGQWTQLGGGANGPVLALASSNVGGQALVVGGQFTQIGGGAANRVARRVGDTWAPMGSGVRDGYVRAAAPAPGGLIVVGGEFTEAGGVATANIARWNGSAWSALGSGVDGVVNALAVFDDGAGDALYAAGEFSTAGGAVTGPLAKWNGSSWSAVGLSGWDSDWFLRALGVFDDGAGESLFVGGLFLGVPGASASSVAAWDGAAWRGLDTGVAGTVYACGELPDDSGGRFVLGGEFLSAGGASTERIAVWIGCAPACAPTDLNCDASVNTADLGLLISAFGTANESADINRDGVVNTADLGILIAAFGG